MSIRNNHLSSGEVSDSEEEFSAKLTAMKNPIPVCRKRKRINDVWKNSTEDNVLDEAFSKAEVKSSSAIPINREVESYHIHESYFYENDSPENPDEPIRKKPLSERLSVREYDKTVPRDHYGVDFESTDDEVVVAILKVLGESKIDLIENVVKTLGRKRALQFCYLAEDVERAGGFFVRDGSRRRTSGGVYLTLIRQSADISKAEKKLMFKETRQELLLRKRKRHLEKRRERQKANKLQLEVEAPDLIENLPSPDVFIEAPDD